jgi:hypothetical protein
VIVGGIVAVLVIGVIVIMVIRNKTSDAPVVQTPVATSSIVHKVIGKSVEGRTIDAYTYGIPGAAKTRLLFVGGIHGGYEWNSVLLAYEFMDYLKGNPKFIPADMSITIIPSANPDGVYKVIGTEGRFSLKDTPTAAQTAKLAVGTGRFNANGVDLNRNFDCKWKPESTWRSQKVSAGTAAFSEPEAAALRDFVLTTKPTAAIFWHSQANAVYASECKNGVLPVTLDIMDAYAKAAGYAAVKSFDAYPVSGDVEGWFASINIPAITVELKTHESVEWDKNFAGIKALLGYFK